MGSKKFIGRGDPKRWCKMAERGKRGTNRNTFSTYWNPWPYFQKNIGSTIRPRNVLIAILKMGLRSFSIIKLAIPTVKDVHSGRFQSSRNCSSLLYKLV